MIRVNRKDLDEAVQSVIKLATTAVDTCGLKLGPVSDASMVANWIMAIVGQLHEGSSGRGISVRPIDEYEGIFREGKPALMWPPNLDEV